MALNIGSILLASITHNFYLFMLLFGAVQGIGASILYVLPIKICWEYFPNRKGVVSGIIIGVFGLGGFSFNLISSALINPEGVKKQGSFYPEDVHKRVPAALRWLCLIYACLSVVTLILLNPKKKEITLKQAEDINETDESHEKLL